MDLHSAVGTAVLPLFPLQRVLGCVATPECVCGVGGPGLIVVLGHCVGGMGVKHGSLSYAMNGHGQN